MAGEEDIEVDEAAGGEVKVERAGLSLGTVWAGAGSGAVWLDFSGNGGCGG